MDKEIIEIILQNQMDMMIVMRSGIKEPNLRLILGDRILKTDEAIKK